jgi:hypothetical protein
MDHQIHHSSNPWLLNFSVRLFSLIVLAVTSSNSSGSNQPHTRPDLRRTSVDVADTGIDIEQMQAHFFG